MLRYNSGSNSFVRVGSALLVAGFIMLATSAMAGERASMPQARLPLQGGDAKAVGNSTVANTILQPTLYQDWESGIGNWWVTNGVWEVGVPVGSPASTPSGVNCAGTILAGNYPANADTRLVSPWIALPTLSGEERLQLKFWHWFLINEIVHGNDQGYIQISTDGVTWQSIGGPYSGWSPVWTQVCVDISGYAGSSVRIGFYFISNWTAEDRGWYVDDISIEKGVVTFNNPEDFEGGVGDWSADNGLWEVGTPTGGPTSTPSGVNCAGTILGGNYTTDENTRLISPWIALPTLAWDERLQLKFWHWFLINEIVHGNDQGYIQISTDGVTWQTIGGPYSGWSWAWTQVCIDLSAYAGSSIRIGFYFVSNWTAEDRGWYVDDISVAKSVVIFNNPEDFEGGVGDWSADNGLWQVGTPTGEPTNTPSGVNCAGTLLDSNYPTEANTRLISPPVNLKTVHGSRPELYFWHWFRINEIVHGNDQGYVQISVNGGSWKNVAGPFSGISTTWTQSYVDLSAYADSIVRIAFYFYSNWTAEDRGWYIDDIRIEGITATLLQSFSATPRTQGIEVSWVLAEACAEMAFFVMRAEDGGNFQKLENINITEEGLRFRFLDASCENGSTYRYRVDVYDDNGRRILFVTDPIPTPTQPLVLHQNHPNPFNPSTSIRYYLPEKCKVDLDIFDVSGRRIVQLIDSEQEKGLWTVEWNGLDAQGEEVNSGIYLYRLRAGKESVTRKMVLLK